jgi:hypothetical protein
MKINSDIAPNFNWNEYDADVAERLVDFDKTPEAIKYFANACHGLSNYAYWFFLSTLWVSYSGFSDIEMWKQLFSSDRGEKLRSIMKPSEVEAYKKLPHFLTIYRAHRPGETDWIAYTLDINIACRFAIERGVNQIAQYSVKKRDVLALFLRRREKEVLVLDKNKVRHVRDIKIAYKHEGEKTYGQCNS